MWRRALGSLLMIAALLLQPAAFAASSKEPDLAPGQMWSIKSATPTTTKVVIGSIENENGKVGVHVSLIDIPVPPDIKSTIPTTRLGHISLEKSALLPTLDKLLATAVAPASDFERGYEHWKEKSGQSYDFGADKAVEMLYEVMRDPPR